MGPVSQETAGQKSDLRADIRTKRRARSELERQTAAIDLAARLLALPEVAQASTVAVTRSTASEPSTALIISALLERGSRVVVPKAQPHGLLSWLGIDSSTNWQVSALGIEEPSGDGGQLDADVVIVPALAVAPDGTRLGQGGGYFDRALEATSAFTVALVFDDEVRDEIPAEEHDLRVQVIVTPVRTMRCMRSSDNPRTN